jgi:uncharacterized protein YdeI (YjbR/CyaY-like superfamily)
MKNYSIEVTKYIEEAEDFAKPILTQLREIIHNVCPEATEKIRWGHPHYDYKRGMCFTPALKNRVVFGFWDNIFRLDQSNLSQSALDADKALGNMTKVSDIPNEKIFAEYIHKAMDNIDRGITYENLKKEKEEITTPEDLALALSKNSLANANFNEMSPSHKREYINWVVDAKTEDTRKKRIDQTVSQVVEKKSKNWKYKK